MKSTPNQRVKSPRFPTKREISSAIGSLPLPEGNWLLTPGMTRYSRLLEASLKQHRLDSPPVHALLKAKAIADAFKNPHVLDGHPTFLSRVQSLEQYAQLWAYLQGLYTPTDVTLIGVPFANHYTHDQSWNPAAGSASASKATGQLGNVVVANLNNKSDSSWAGVYIPLQTTQAEYGTLSQVTFEADVNWRGEIKFNLDWSWARDVAGSTRITGRVWLVAYQYNVATNKFEPLLNNSASVTQLMSESFSGAGGSNASHNGTLSGATARLKFVAEPARQYFLGVMSQIEITQNLVAAYGGKSLTPPPPGGYVCYGILNATVDDMHISHTVMAK
jgi:hypothetical protein